MKFSCNKRGSAFSSSGSIMNLGIVGRKLSILSSLPDATSKNPMKELRFRGNLTCIRIKKFKNCIWWTKSQRYCMVLRKVSFSSTCATNTRTTTDCRPFPPESMFPLVVGSKYWNSLR